MRAISVTGHTDSCNSYSKDSRGWFYCRSNAFVMCIDAEFVIVHIPNCVMVNDDKYSIITALLRGAVGNIEHKEYESISFEKSITNDMMKDLRRKGISFPNYRELAVFNYTDNAGKDYYITHTVHFRENLMSDYNQRLEESYNKAIDYSKEMEDKSLRDKIGKLYDINHSVYLVDEVEEFRMIEHLSKELKRNKR